MEDCNLFDEDGKPRDAPLESVGGLRTVHRRSDRERQSKLSVVILGGANDLSDKVPKSVRLIEVTVKAYRDVDD